MAVPKQRSTKSKQGRRRSHLALKKQQMAKCKNCNEPVKPHEVCKNCGYYRGRQVVDVLAKLSKREKKEKEEELAEQAPEKRK